MGMKKKAKMCLNLAPNCHLHYELKGKFFLHKMFYCLAQFFEKYGKLSFMFTITHLQMSQICAFSCFLPSFILNGCV